MVEINTEMTREAARRLGAIPAGLDQVDSALRSLARLQLDEFGPIRTQYDEVVEESGLLGQLLSLRVAAVELADSGHSTGGSFLMAQQRRVLALLTASLDDEAGRAGTSEDIHDYYLQQALDAAGIDLADWDPGLGLDHNGDIVDKVYEYYGGLYESDPDTFWWAGMAALIGPSFFGGFRDLETFADLFGLTGDVADVAGRIPGFPIVPGPFAPVAEWTAGELENELRWYQVQLLQMQQEIFFDMATAHEAYRSGGMAAIEALFADDSYGYGDETIEAWRQIDEGHTTGDQSLIATGNETLLFREQQFIIDDNYVDMRERPITGDAMTYAMTAIGAPSVPGAQSFPEVFPVEVDVSQYVGSPRSVGIPWIGGVDLPHVGAEGTVTITTPLPDGNIASFDDRWELIQNDTLPTYVDLAANHPEIIQEQLDIPVGDRASDYQFDERIDDIATWLATDWDLDVDVAFEVGG